MVLLPTLLKMRPTLKTSLDYPKLKAGRIKERVTTAADPQEKNQFPQNQKPCRVKKATRNKREKRDQKKVTRLKKHPVKHQPIKPNNFRRNPITPPTILKRTNRMIRI